MRRASSALCYVCTTPLRRSLGEADATRASELLRGLGQSLEAVLVLQPSAAALARAAEAAPPESVSLLGAF